MLAAIVASSWITDRRLARRGAPCSQVLDVVVWAVPLGIVGARPAHVLTSPRAFFGPGGSPVRALFLWNGGLEMWGALLLGGAGAWIGFRRPSLAAPAFLDAAAPAPRPAAFAGSSTFHPLSLYEALWVLVAAALLLLWERRARRTPGTVFLVAATAYALGRLWMDPLRAEASAQVVGPPVTAATEQRRAAEETFTRAERVLAEHAARAETQEEVERAAARQVATERLASRAAAARRAGLVVLAGPTAGAPGPVTGVAPPRVPGSAVAGHDEGHAPQVPRRRARSWLAGRFTDAARRLDDGG